MTRSCSGARDSGSIPGNFRSAGLQSESLQRGPVIYSSWKCGLLRPASAGIADAMQDYRPLNPDIK